MVEEQLYLTLTKRFYERNWMELIMKLQISMFKRVLIKLLPELTATLIMKKMNFEEVSCKRPDKPFYYTWLINFYMCDLLLDTKKITQQRFSYFK